MDPIRRRKKELEDERPNEFAPPSDYSKTLQGRIRDMTAMAATKRAKMDTASSTVDSGHYSYFSYTVTGISYSPCSISYHF